MRHFKKRQILIGSGEVSDFKRVKQFGEKPKIPIMPAVKD